MNIFFIDISFIYTEMGKVFHRTWLYKNMHYSNLKKQNKPQTYSIFKEI